MKSLHGVPSESLKNIKNYFCHHDCITNLKYDVSFSLLPKYLCNANCKFCYIKDYWEKPSDDINNLVIDEAYTKRLFNFFRQFRFVNCIDNLQMLKNKFPNLYTFYKIHSNKMSYGCLTDKAIDQQFEILMNEMKFKTIHEISLTDLYVSENPDILEKLIKLTKRYSCRIIKFIYTFNDREKSNTVFKSIEEFANKEDIDLIRHKNIMDDKYHNGLYDLSDTELHFKPLYAENGKIFHVLGDGAIHIYYDKLKFSTDDGASSFLLPEFGTIDDMGFNLIIKLIKGKIVKYNDYIKNMKNIDNNLFFDYYKFICENIEIHEDANFIPEFILTKTSGFYEILIGEGWSSSSLGLIKLKENEKVIPLITWKKSNEKNSV
jgi:hypothetical protein